MNKIKILPILFIVILSCNVSFDSELEDYINNVADRTPLNFTLTLPDESGVKYEVIDNLNSVNLGYNISDKTVECTIINREKSDIKLNDFSGLSGDFKIDPIPGFTLKSGKSFTFTLTFDYSIENANKRLQDSIVFTDNHNRKFNLELWSTSRTQPLTILNKDGEPITKFDLLGWGDGRSFYLTLKNEGIKEINILDKFSNNNAISIKLNGENDLQVNEEMELELIYSKTSDDFISTEITIKTDYEYDLSGFVLPIVAGGPLNISLFDSTSNKIDKIDMGEYNNNEIIKSFTIKNNLDRDLNLEVRLSSSENFKTTLTNPLVLSKEFSFDISFLPTVSGFIEDELILMDQDSGRKYRIRITGNS